MQLLTWTEPDPMFRALSLLALLSLPAVTACTRDESRDDVHAEVPKIAIDGELAEILAEAETWTIYALDPTSMWDDKTFEKDLHGYGILGESTVSDVEERRVLAVALQDGIRTSDGSVAACFNPRHGVSAETAAGRVDLVLCFECLQVNVYGAEGERDGVLTTKAPRAAFDAIYARHGLTIAD